ncbi:hypothetical protein Tco_0788755 [Tanacetum coccineum]
MGNAADANPFAANQISLFGSSLWSGKSDVYTSVWHNYFSSGTGFWLCIEDLTYYLISGLSWNLVCNSYLEVADISGYKDAPGSLLFFLSSFCISVESVGYKVVPGSGLDGFELYEFWLLHLFSSLVEYLHVFRLYWCKLGGQFWFLVGFNQMGHCILVGQCNLMLDMEYFLHLFGIPQHGLIWLNEVEQFYSKSGKKQSNTSKANSVIRDKDKDDIPVTSFKRRQQDALRKEASATRRMQDLMRQFNQLLQKHITYPSNFFNHGKADGSTIDKKFKAKDGTRTAYDVSLTDDGRTPEIFNLMSGNTSTSWERLDVGAVLSHTFELESNVKTVFHSKPAVVTFRVPTKAALQEAYLAPLLPLEILSDKPRESTLGLAKKLLAKYGSLVSVISIVVLFVYLVATPSKSGAAKGSKKKR